MTPTVETSLEKVGELVQLMQSGGAARLTSTQSQRLVGYLGSLEDMRGQIGSMVQYYEADDNILSDLTLLMDRIDESLGIVKKSTTGMTSPPIPTNLIITMFNITLQYLHPIRHIQHTPITIPSPYLPL